MNKSNVMLCGPYQKISLFYPFPIPIDKKIVAIMVKGGGVQRL